MLDPYIGKFYLNIMYVIMSVLEFSMLIIVPFDLVKD